MEGHFYCVHTMHFSEPTKIESFKNGLCEQTFGKLKLSQNQILNLCNITCDDICQISMSKTTEVIKHLAKFVTNCFEIRKPAITG